VEGRKGDRPWKEGPGAGEAEDRRQFKAGGERTGTIHSRRGQEQERGGGERTGDSSGQEGPGEAGKSRGGDRRQFRAKGVRSRREKEGRGQETIQGKRGQEQEAGRRGGGGEDRRNFFKLAKSMERRETSKKLKFKLYVFSKIPFKAEAGKRLDWREKTGGSRVFHYKSARVPLHNTCTFNRDISSGMWTCTVCTVGPMHG
jgi:hypothetical protein